MSGRRRLLFWLVFLGVAGILAVLPEPERRDGEAVEAVSRPARPVVHAEADGLGPAGNPDSGLEAEVKANLFAARTWAVPPPPPPPPTAAPVLPAPPPGAPPLPFIYLGKLEDGSRQRAFLQKGDRAYVVSAGDVIDDIYRVESIMPEHLTLTYLPLDIAQTLSVGNPL